MNSLRILVDLVGVDPTTFRAGRAPGSAQYPRRILVDLVGVEPTTSSMPWKRAPNCATGPLRKNQRSGAEIRTRQNNSRLLAEVSQTLRSTEVHVYCATRQFYENCENGYAEGRDRVHEPLSYLPAAVLGAASSTACYSDGTGDAFPCVLGAACSVRFGQSTEPAAVAVGAGRPGDAVGFG